ncbi:uncharacterized protein RJT20DRAFT_145680 [Scheffersomyces xylosifermentans]|uniref:uncharacterized protein n=1 Tax=Scheffersomyces xylosifermentans TaxID=1304137 RepID=UPI00315CD42D
MYYDEKFKPEAPFAKIGASGFGGNYPKILASGYWNGLRDHPLHIFEYLGEQVPKEERDSHKAYRNIKERLQELHSVGISHNNIRISNIHVGVSGKILLIGFGRSDSENNVEHMKKDFERVGHISDMGGHDEDEG